MIIGIDEVGNFAKDSDKFHYFVAVQLDQNQNGIEIKRQQFENWRNALPADRKNQNGEAKGNDLSDEQLFLFANQVIATEPLVRITQVRVVPAENPIELIEWFKAIELSRLETAMTMYANANRPRIAEAYQKMIYWYKNRNYEHYLKILTLSKTIPEVLRNTIGVSILLSLLPKNGVDNLLNIKIKIDRDFINGPQPRIFFGELLRSSFYSFTKEHPIPVLDIWKDGEHPFLKKYSTPDGKIDFQEILRDNCHFYHSHDHFEIQMADIVGNIIHKYQNRQRCKESYEKLVEKFPKKEHEIIHLKLDEEPENGAGIKML